MCGMEWAHSQTPCDIVDHMRITEEGGLLDAPIELVSFR